MTASLVSAPLFTIAQIARGLRCTRQNVHDRLGRIPPNGEVFVNGQRVRAWGIESLPVSLMERLTAVAAQKGYSCIKELLNDPFQRYQHHIPLSQIGPKALEKARKLRKAMAEIIPLQNDRSLSRGELVQRGLAEYARVFGYNISDRQWRALFARVITRDNGAEEWSRLELYLDDNSARQPRPDSSSVARERQLHLLQDALAHFEGKAQLAATEKIYVWTKSCDELHNAGKRAKRIKNAVIKALLNSCWFGADPKTIRRNLDRQWKGYCSNSGVLTDRRTTRDQRLKLPEADKNKLIARSIDCGGRVSQAFRELRDTGNLSTETLARTIANPVCKSHVPKGIRREITSEVNRLMPLHRGEREFELRGPYVPQNHSTIAAGQVMQLDDVTLPIYYWENDPESPRGLFFGRGQWILAIDVRSRMALGHALHSASNYNMRIVRSLLLRVHDAFGLPETLLLERGMWRTAKIIKGDELNITATEQGLREFGIKFQHRTTPRGKVIERVIGLLQNQMERLPGYVGRDERHDRFERVQDQIRDIESGREHPSKFFLSKADLLAHLDALILRYNHERQDGELKGSPIECWNTHLLPEGTVNLGEKARFLLAHHKKPVKVQSRGIRLPTSLGGGLYYNEYTGRFAGETMLAWINPDEPEAIALTSLDRRNGPYIIDRADPLPPIGASADQLAKVQAQIDAHNNYTRTQYRVIQDHLVRRQFRKLLIDNSTAQLSKRFDQGSHVARQKREEGERSLRLAQRRVRDSRVNVLVDSSNASRAAAAADLAREAYE